MKKFMALLATGLVMALSATTVFAAGSVSLDTVKAVDANEVVQGVSEDTLPEEVKNVEASVTDNSDLTVSEAKDLIAEIEADNKMALAGVSVKAYADIVVKLFDENGKEIKVSEENPVYIKLDAIASGISGNVKVFNKQGADWVELEVKNGLVKFTHFSPVMVLTYESAETTTGGGHWYYDPEIDGPVDPSLPGAATSPKTGVLPVAAFAATICLAGAVVCGRKVK